MKTRQAPEFQPDVMQPLCGVLTLAEAFGMARHVDKDRGMGDVG